MTSHDSELMKYFLPFNKTLVLKLPLRLWFLVGYFFLEENEAQRGNFLRYFIR